MADTLSHQQSRSPSDDKAAPSAVPSLWTRAQAEAPPELSEILQLKADGPDRSIAYKRPLIDWLDRHAARIGQGGANLLTLSEGSYTARSGSIGKDDRRMFWLAKNIEDPEALEALRRTFQDKPFLESAIVFRPQQNAPGGFSVMAWSGPIDDELIRILREENVQFEEFGPLEERPRQARFQVPALPDHIWIYAPGARAAYWELFHQSGIAAIGWDNLGDLSLLDSRDAILQRMKDVNPQGESTVNASQCFDFAHRMEPGDWIFVKRGRREIIGFGVVISGYRYDPTRDRYQNVRDVLWQKSGSWPIGEGRFLPMKTLTEITDDTDLVEDLEELLGLTTETPPTVFLSPPAPPYTVEACSAETAIPADTIRKWEARLRRKQHVVFQGPPGTGKTFIAERLARIMISDTAGFVETVQFHPSYSYEDFMHGIRPAVLDGQLVFQPGRGRFMQFCDRASQVTDGSPCVMIIDEINRGNLSRIFGELMYLLEYRDKEIPLAGQTRPFGIPGNVFLIGTMNTADRSIALVDHALRRRFSFIHLGPDYDVLRSHLEKNGLPANGLVQTLQNANDAIGDRNYEIGISFFLKDGIALRHSLQDVWESEIEPYLEEYFYDQPGKLDPFRWEALLKKTLADWPAKG